MTDICASCRNMLTYYTLHDTWSGNRKYVCGVIWPCSPHPPMKECGIYEKMVKNDSRRTIKKSEGSSQ